MDELNIDDKQIEKGSIANGELLLQPTYQNREAIEESIAKGSGGGKMPSLNNNLSELDTLLQDLSNARYNAHYQERGQHPIFMSSVYISFDQIR